MRTKLCNQVHVDLKKHFVKWSCLLHKAFFCLFCVH